MKALMLIPTIILILLLRVALRLGVDYWDGYDYLSNALFLAGKGGQYNNVRPPLVSIFNLFPLLHRSSFSFIAPHLIALTISALALVFLYLLLRLTFDSDFCLLGVALMSLNPLFIHYSVFVMSDIPGMLFLTIGFCLYLRTPQSTLGFLGASLSRYTNLLAFGSLFLFELLRGRKVKRLLVITGASLALFYLIHLVIFAFTVRPAWRIPVYILAILKAQLVTSQRRGFIDPLYEYPVDLYIAFTLPVIILAFVGIYKSVKERTDHDLLMLCWFVPILLFLTFISRHKEARYLFCVFPPFIYFAVRGIQLIPVRKWATIAVLILPSMLAITELKRFNDPVYSRPFLQTVAAQKVCWEGIYNIYPKDHRLFPHDEFMYFHHINSTAMNYWAGGCEIETDVGNRVYTVANDPPEPPEPLIVNQSRISYR